MREAGFEPAHPEITELKPVALTKLGNPRVHRNVTVTNIFGFSFLVPLYLFFY